MRQCPQSLATLSPGREVQELYDVQADPGELHNRYGEPALAPLVDALKGRLHDWMLAHVR